MDNQYSRFIWLAAGVFVGSGLMAAVSYTPSRGTTTSAPAPQIRLMSKRIHAPTVAWDYPQGVIALTGTPTTVAQVTLTPSSSDESLIVNAGADVSGLGGGGPLETCFISVNGTAVGNPMEVAMGGPINVTAAAPAGRTTDVVAFMCSTNTPGQSLFNASLVAQLQP